MFMDMEKFEKDMAAIAKQQEAIRAENGGKSRIREISNTERKPICPKCNSSDVVEWEEDSEVVGTKLRLKRCYNPKCRLLAVETWKLTEIESRDAVDMRITKLRMLERKDELNSSITMKQFYFDSNNVCRSITYP